MDATAVPAVEPRRLMIVAHTLLQIRFEMENERLRIAAIAGASLICLAFDASMPLGVAAGLPYVVLVLLTFRSNSSWMTAGSACLATVLTVAGGLLSPPAQASGWIYLTNRALTIFVIAAVAAALLFNQHVRRVLSISERERWRAEAALGDREALAQLGSLASLVAHEVRNALGGIIGTVQIVRRRLDKGDRHGEALDDAAARIDELDERLEDLLRYARPSPPEFGLLQVSKLVRGAVDAVCNRLDTQDIRFDIDGDTVEIEADRRQLGQALTNLLTNAVEAIQGQGLVRLTTEATGDRCTIEISDTGSGLPDVATAELFRPFYTTRPNGPGLGLAVVRQTVESHNGTIHIENRERGGARAIIQLPRTQESL